MQSSSNQYLAKVDHLRAFAAFQVFVFHFLHHSEHCLNVLCQAIKFRPLNPLFAVLEQGNGGVALFMCLSGYIFSFLTDGHDINPIKFSYNRLLRLLPLMVFWDIMVALFYDHTPTTGAWSIYVELEYYALFPVLFIYVRAYGAKVLMILLAVMLLLRLEEWHRIHKVGDLFYYSIVGRADQLLLGSLAFFAEKHLKIIYPQSFRRICNYAGVIGAVGIMGSYEYFSLAGGVYFYPQDGWYWVFSPLTDGIFYSLIILYYLQLNIPEKLSRILSPAGKWSYSIYLGQFFFIPYFYLVVAHFTGGITENFYARIAIAACFAFPLLAAFSSVTYRLVEKPFLRFRKNYIIKTPTEHAVELK